MLDTAPVLAVCPVIPPVLVPSVQAKVLGMEAVSGVVVKELLHTLSVTIEVSAGFGFTVTITAFGGPTHVGAPDIVVGIAR